VLKHNKGSILSINQSFYHLSWKSEREGRRRNRESTGHPHPDDKTPGISRVVDDMEYNRRSIYTSGLIICFRIIGKINGGKN